jgi:cytochrome b6-f complex iron-sulfur subunit
MDSGSFVENYQEKSQWMVFICPFSRIILDNRCNPNRCSLGRFFSEGDCRMDRRAFMLWVGAGMLASSLPAAIVACSSPDAEKPAADAAPKNRPDGFMSVGTVGDLEKQGHLNASVGGVSVMVVRDPANSAKLIAVNSKCTHAGCAVEWKNKAFACPCHGSQFKTNGTVAKGPAKKPLATFNVKLEGKSVLVKA